MQILLDVDVDKNDDPEEMLEQVEEALRDAGISATANFYEED